MIFLGLFLLFLKKLKNHEINNHNNNINYMFILLIQSDLFCNMLCIGSSSLAVSEF